MVKKLTKILMVVALATFSFQSFAQTFGVKAGLNMSNTSKIYDDDDSKMLMGFHVGATAEIEVADAFSVETGLILSTKGEKNDYENAAGKDVTVKTVPMYLEIPINGKYGIDLGGKKLYFAAGPYLAFGIGGKYKSDGESEKIDWGNDEEKDDMKRLDFGLNIGAGVEFGAIGIGVQYGLGLTSVMPKSEELDNNDDYKYPKNRVIGISVSYKLGK